MPNDFPNRPERCQALTQKGQCSVDAVDGKSLCEYHLRDRDYNDQQDLKAYILADTPYAQATAKAAGRHSRVEELKNLREEISLVRALVERRLNMVESNADFLAAIGTVNSLFVTLEKLVSSCHRLEVNLGSLLSKAAILDLAKEIVAILMTELEGVDGHENIVDSVTEQILAKISNPEE